MMTRKLLENWIVWIVVDVVYVGMFIWRGLYLTAANYAIYLVLAVLGYVAWKRSLTARDMIRVVLTGSESTGKTTLAERLAATITRSSCRNSCAASPRRVGADRIQRSRPDRSRTNGAGRRTHCARWRSVDSGHRSPEHRRVLSPLLRRAARRGSKQRRLGRRPDLYLLCEPDIPWVADEVRDRGHMRAEMHELFRGRGVASGAPAVTVRGDREARSLARDCGRSTGCSGPLHPTGS